MRRIHPTSNSTFHDKNSKSLTCIKTETGLKHFHDHTLKYGLQNTLNPFCSCGPYDDKYYHLRESRFYSYANASLQRFVL